MEEMMRLSRILYFVISLTRRVNSRISLEVEEEFDRHDRSLTQGRIGLTGIRLWSVAACFFTILSAYSSHVLPCEPVLNLTCPPSDDPQVFIDDLLVQTNGGVSTPPPCPAVQELEWDWGDGSFSRSFFPASHSYDSYGTYTVNVSALDADQSVIVANSCEISVLEPICEPSLTLNCPPSEDLQSFIDDLHC
jgi:hypothetical protein